jgi:flagellar biosynthesis chaperone FliJ
MTAQGSQIELQGSQIANFKRLVNKLEEKISEQEQQIKKWKKLADRRGRAIEW